MKPKFHANPDNKNVFKDKTKKRGKLTSFGYQIEIFAVGGR